MTIDNIKLVNFRNHINKNIQFSSGANLIIGNNGAGKTTILDAIDILCLGKSSIARKESEVINYHTNYTNINADITTDESKMHIAVQILLDKSTERVSKRLLINDKARKFMDIYDKVTVVSFYPDELSVITGEPSKRRKYLDSIISKTQRHYKDTLLNYNKVVLQRNKLLETIGKYNTGHIQLDYWNTKFAELGNSIINERMKLTKYLNENLSYNLEKLNTNIEINLTYKTQELTTEMIKENLQKELKYKATISGPHRDDLKIETINMLPLASFGSRGEQRTALLGIKLTEIDYIKNKLEKNPILLLDDIFSELDQKHKECISNTIGQYQTIITSTEQLPLDCNIIEI